MQRPATQSAPALSGPQTLAYVDPANAGAINVVSPNSYTPEMAAHEATHTFQFGRNNAFIDHLQALLPGGTQNVGNYNYGGLSNLQSNHPNIGILNAEQQASIVGDLMKAQHSLPAHPTAHQLNQWDATKAAYERPIQQLQAIPGAETGVAGTIDNYTHSLGLGEPMSYMKSLLGLSKLLAPVPNPVPGAPSAALGYPNLSTLVR